MDYRLGPTLLSAADIRSRVRELAQAISRDYAGRNLLLICVLKGAAVFWADLCRAVQIPCQSDFVAMESYGDSTAPLGQPRFTKAGVVLQRGVIPAITYTWFNMEDPVVGGYTNDKIALRRAIGMGYNVEEEIRVIRQRQGEWATQVVPPGVSGHEPIWTVPAAVSRTSPARSRLAPTRRREDPGRCR